MSTRKKRAYSSEGRKAQAIQTKSRILEAAKKLFQTDGFEKVTITQIAESAKVSAPTIYALFKSKRGVLQALIDAAFPAKMFEELVQSAMQEKSAVNRLKITAKLCRNMYDAERSFIPLLQGASLLSPELKHLEKEKEERRYKRQERFTKIILQEKKISTKLSLKKARDLLWTFTGRDFYRMLVIERGWASNEYEKWLTQQLIDIFLKHT